MVMVSWEGFEVSNKPINKVVETLERSAREDSFKWVTTLNPQIVLQTDQNKDIKRFIQKSIMITADGEGIVRAIKKKQNIQVEKVTGIDLVEMLLKRSVKIYLLGATHPALCAAMDRIRDNKKVEAKIVGSHHGYFKKEGWVEIVRELKERRPEFIFVGMGCPKQEAVLMSLASNLDYGVGIGVGGSIDVLSGWVKRAPKLFRKMNLEWLFRCLQEPRRFKQVGSLWEFYRQYI